TRELRKLAHGDGGLRGLRGAARPGYAQFHDERANLVIGVRGVLLRAGAPVTEVPRVAVDLAGALIGELDRRPHRDIGAAGPERRDRRRGSAHHRHDPRPGRDVAELTGHDQGDGVVPWPGVDVARILRGARSTVAEVPFPRDDIANALVGEADFNAAWNRAGNLEGKDSVDLATGRRNDHLTRRSSRPTRAAHLQADRERAIRGVGVSVRALARNGSRSVAKGPRPRVDLALRGIGHRDR